MSGWPCATQLCALPDRRRTRNAVEYAEDLTRKDGAMRETILLLQDNSAKAAIVQGLLARSSGTPFLVEWFRSCTAGLVRLKDRKKNGIAAILINLLLPD